VIVGAGVAGLSTAYYLRGLDHEVTIVDAATIGARSASSYGNGGWICPAQAGPLPEPGLTLTGFRALLNRDSSLYFDPAHLVRLVPWLLRFWSYSNSRDFEAGTRALAALGRRTFELTGGLVDAGLEFELHRLGMIVAGEQSETVRAMEAKLRPMQEFGYAAPRLLDDEALHALEPALSPRARAGLLIEEQWHVRADSFVAALGGALERMGVRIVENAPVTGFSVANRRVRSATTGAGEIDGDVFVLCAGSWSGSLSSRLGTRIPLQPGKGYTFMLDADPTPRHGLLFSDLHAGATPLRDGVRMGGTMEFTGFNRSVDRRRIDPIFRGVRAFLNVTSDAPRDEWAGLRPITADGLPIVDRLPRSDNAYIATGYSMLGMTMALPAGEALATMVSTGVRPEVLAPFRADRFPRWLIRRPAGRS
jgi:D-amino-acid dehydrogenase